MWRWIRCHRLEPRQRRRRDSVRAASAIVTQVGSDTSIDPKRPAAQSLRHISPPLEYPERLHFSSRREQLPVWELVTFRIGLSVTKRIISTVIKSTLS